jgi:hypothetical protein
VTQHLGSLNTPVLAVGSNYWLIASVDSSHIVWNKNNIGVATDFHYRYNGAHVLYQHGAQGAF